MLAASAAVQQKAFTLLTAGRVKVVSVDASIADLLVQGSSPDPYSCMFIKRGASQPTSDCTCAARVTCSHLLACALILDASFYTTPKEPS